MHVLQKFIKSSWKNVLIYWNQKVYLKKRLLYIANKKHVLYTDLKKNNALIFKVLKSIYIFESTNRFTYEHIRIDAWF